MSADLVAAYTQRIVAGWDPMLKIISKSAEGDLAVTEISVDERRLTMFNNISDQIQAEKDGSNDGVRIAALQRMQNRYADLIGNG